MFDWAAGLGAMKSSALKKQAAGSKVVGMHLTAKKDYVAQLYRVIKEKQGQYLR